MCVFFIPVFYLGFFSAKSLKKTEIKKKIKSKVMMMCLCAKRNHLSGFIGPPLCYKYKWISQFSLVFLKHFFENTILFSCLGLRASRKCFHLNTHNIWNECNHYNSSTFNEGILQYHGNQHYVNWVGGGSIVLIIRDEDVIWSRFFQFWIFLFTFQDVNYQNMTNRCFSIFFQFQ